MELNVVKCTNRSGLFEKLENIQSRLSLCEKALAEYLETKRLAFPRFYFVSSADLLDILSNGNEPYKLMKHLTKSATISLIKIYQNSQWKTSNTDQPTTSVYINKSPQIGFPKKKKEIAESL